MISYAIPAVEVKTESSYIRLMMSAPIWWLILSLRMPKPVIGIQPCTKRKILFVLLLLSEQKLEGYSIQNRRHPRRVRGRGPRQKISILEQSFGIDIFCCGREERSEVWDTISFKFFLNNEKKAVPLHPITKTVISLWN